MTLASFVQWGKERIEQAGIECADPVFHMKQILGASIGLSTVQFYLRWQEELSESELQEATAFLEKRLTGIPFQYLVGHEWFWHSRFEVGEGVLIPRKETEHLVEHLLLCRGPEPIRVAELGAGSGNIGISVLLERPQWEWHGIEINPESIRYLGKNVGTLLPLEAKYFIHQGNFFDLIKDLAPLDAVISNPPYIARDAISRLSREVQKEPKLALCGGEIGTEILEHLVAASLQFLKPQGLFLSEIGSDQKEAAIEILKRVGFQSIEVLTDYRGHPRVIKGLKA